MNQTNEELSVSVGSTDCDVTESSYTAITCHLERSAVTGTYDVTIMSGDDVHMTSSDAFTFVEGDATGSVDSVTPTNGNRLGG